ncbi:hypothetical protein [uncultured Treponema sp.]|uniref:hypothetical protein n=1 Tax=uncultured Treponema sp. TaxID=162155 RepID=UPI0025F80548|nr:hypothetical protein [uncultured Treponema sp.]
MKVENGKWKTENGKLKIWGKFFLAAGILSGGLLFASCDTLQDSLSSEQKADLIEETGSASIAGKVWYYDGISTTDFSKTEGASLAVSFSKKTAMVGTREITDDGDIIYNYELSGSLTSNYISKTGQSSSVVTKISGGKIILDSVSSPVVSVSAGSMSADGRTFRLNMTPIAYLLDAETVNGNVIDSVEIKLNGFVCDEGKQKGRAIAALSQKIAVKPFYDNETITDGIVFTTISSTLGKVISIPTKGSVGLTSDAKIEFSSDDSAASTLSSSNFALGTDSNAITISCAEELKGKTFSGSFKISGFVPELNASSYTRTFKVNFEPVYVTLDGLLDEKAWSEDAVTSTDSYANPENYNLSKVYVTNDSKNLYVAVEGNFAFGAGDRIILMIDNTSSSETGKSNSDGGYNNYYGPATNSSFSGVDFYLSNILATPEMQDYKWISDAPGRTDMATSATSSRENIIEYKIPLSIIANATSGNNLKVFAAVTSYAWTTINEMTLRDCVPSASATVSDGGQSLAIDFSKGLSYIVKAGD